MSLTIRDELEPFTSLYQCVLGPHSVGIDVNRHDAGYHIALASSSLISDTTISTAIDTSSTIGIGTRQDPPN